jgi:superfamily I DNA/RNA helicase
MELSVFQSKILKAVQSRVRASQKKGLLVEALAGAGKSTMIWLICQELQTQGFFPQEVAAVVFGRKNKEDLQKKIEQKVGTDWGVVVRTLHSLCYGIYRDAMNVKHQRVNNESGKYTRIAQEFGLFPLKDDRRGIDTSSSLLEGTNPAIYSEKDFTDLLDRLRLYCLDATSENVEYLVNLYKLGINDIELVTAAAELCLSEGLKVATNRRYWIDMTDMVWVPWVMRDDSRFSAAITGRREQFRVLLLDEAQDTDLLQIEMLSLLINPARSFLTAVGDRHQACYFFRGALNDGMDRIKERFQGENLPLPVCYRCGTSHLELVREVFPKIPIQPRPGAPAGEIRVVLNRDFHRIFDDEHLSYMGVCRKNAPLVKAAIQLLAAGKPAKIKDRNIGGRLVARVKDICQKQRVKYDPDTFIRVSFNYEEAQSRRLQDFPNSDNQILELTDMLEAIRALFQAYEPSTFKAWEKIVERIFDESGYSPISLYTIHSGKGGEGQVSFIIYPEDLPFSHPKQVPEEKEQEDHLLYVALTRTLADGAEGSGVLYLVCREADERDEDDLAPSQRGKVKWPEWLPLKYRQLWNWGKPNQPESVYVEPALEEPATVSDVGLVEPEPDESDLNYWSDSMLAIEPTETAAPPPTAPTVDEISELNEAEKLELSTLEKQIKQALAIPKRLWYEGGKALVRVRDNRLYRESHSDFHKYCLERFNKTRRHIDRWITAAAARDNLACSGCKILPEAESVLRPIASLPPEQQVEVWNRAVEAVVGCPTAAKVEEIRDMFLGKTLPQPIENEPAELEPRVQTNWSKSSAQESRSQAQARDWIQELELTEMESLHLWLGELIQSLRKGED